MVIVAFDRTNLLPTAKVFRDRYSDAIVVIASDNDQFTDGKPGLTDARKAAAAVSGVVACPQFHDLSPERDDDGEEFVKSGINAALNQAEPESP